MKKLILEFISTLKRFKKYDKKRIEYLLDIWDSDNMTESETIFWLDQMTTEGSPDVSQTKEDFLRGWDVANKFNKFLRKRKGE